MSSRPMHVRQNQQNEGAGVPNASRMPWNQLHWNANNECTYQRHAFAKVRKSLSRNCIHCGLDITEHNPDTVDEEDVRIALQGGRNEFSTIIAPTTGMGGLYLGSYQSAVNHKELKNHKVGYVVNAAGPKIFDFFRNFKKKRDNIYSTNKILVTDELNWVDDEDQKVDLAQLVGVIDDIESIRLKGMGVLVHCAQGKSRSTTVVLAYLRRYTGTDQSLKELLEYVKQKRVVAEPNPGFMKWLAGHWEHLKSTD